MIKSLSFSFAAITSLHLAKEIQIPKNMACYIWNNYTAHAWCFLSILFI